MKRTVLMSVILAAGALSGFAHADDNKHQRYNNYENNGFVRDVGDHAYDDNRNDSRGNSVRYDTARVLSVDPIIDENYQQSRRECWSEPSRQYNASYSQPIYRNNGYNDNQYNRRSNSSNGNAIIGGIIGGVLGHQVGKGDGRRAATVAGAVLGYAIAREVGKGNNNNAYRNESYGDNRYYGNDGYGNGGYQTEPTGRLRCRMVNDDRYDYGYQSNGYRDDRYNNDRNLYVNQRYQDRYNHDRYDDRYDNARVTGYRVTFRYHDQVYTTVTDYHPGSTIRVRVNVEAEGNNEVGYNDNNNRYSRY
jgi:uncharacterized protein YcfJ